MRQGTIAFFITPLTTRAQQITGFWKVQSVAMGDRSKTPVAKWFKISGGGTYPSGNAKPSRVSGLLQFGAGYLPVQRLQVF